MTNPFKEQFLFTKNERRAVFLLIILILLSILLRQFIPLRFEVSKNTQEKHPTKKELIPSNENSSQNDETKEETVFKKSVPNKQKTASGHIKSKTYPSSNFRKLDSNNKKPKVQKSKLKPLHNFDPNTVTKETLLDFGLSPYVVNNWHKFLESGASFYKSEQLQKIYGLEIEDYNRIAPYIKIKKTSSSKSYSKKEEIKIEVNTADQEDFKSLYGIGDHYAKKIINFRNKLGGFYHINQIAETYGLPDSTFQKIKENLEIIPLVAKMNLNTSTKEEFASHPYISWKEADIIIKYRNQHGFSETTEIEKIKIFDANKIKMLLPYLTI